MIFGRNHLKYDSCSRFKSLEPASAFASVPCAGVSLSSTPRHVGAVTVAAALMAASSATVSVASFAEAAMMISAEACAA